jgi:hypothetical protein
LLIVFVLEAAVGLERLLQQLAELGVLLTIGEHLRATQRQQRSHHPPTNAGRQ